MTTPIVSAKDPDEDVFVTFDFVDILAGDAIVGTPTVTCTVDVGTDAQAANMVSGTATAVAGVVQQKIIDGVAGNDYRLRCVATTAGGRTLVLAMILPVRVA